MTRRVIGIGVILGIVIALLSVGQYVYVLQECGELTALPQQDLPIIKYVPSPHCDKVAFVYRSEDAWPVVGIRDLYTNETFLSKSLGLAIFEGLVWSPDSRFILFVTSEEDVAANSNLNVIRIYSLEVTRITKDQYCLIQDYSWEPDGTILFTRNCVGTQTMHVVKADIEGVVIESKLVGGKPA